MLRRRSLCLALATTAVLVGCGKPEAPPAPPAPIAVELPAKQEVHAILVKQLESGVDDEGTDVPLLVTEDVKDAQGHILIPQGSPITGKVTWSRRADMMSGIVNRPARLKFKPATVKTIDGQLIEVCADTENPEEPYELNRANTKREEVEKQLEAISKDEQNNQVLQAVSDLFEKGDARVLDTPETRTRLVELGKQLNLPDLQSLDQTGEADKVKDLISSLRSGQSLSQLGQGGQGQMALLAISELANLAGSVGNVLGRLTHGRNIKAYVGTPVTVYVAKPASVKVNP